MSVLLANSAWQETVLALSTLSSCSSSHIFSLMCWLLQIHSMYKVFLIWTIYHLSINVQQHKRAHSHFVFKIHFYLEKWFQSWMSTLSSVHEKALSLRTVPPAQFRNHFTGILLLKYMLS